MVKRHGYFGSLDEWLEVYDFTDHLLQTIQELSENRDLWNLRIEHYDKVSTSLSDLAIDWLNTPPSSFTIKLRILLLIARSRMKSFF